jgi:NhaP-type Na+/H+ or K+/H+ antiporter
VNPFNLIVALIGVLLSPEVLGAIDVATLGDETSIREKAARLTLAVGLLGVALRIPREYPRRHWRAPTVLIVLGMILMWSISTSLVLVFLDLPFWSAALIGAIVTATDPVAASPIVTGSTAEANLPERLRNAISFESGGNDGLSYLLVLLPSLMLTRPADEALSHWLTRTLLWDVGVATSFGVLLGYVAAKALRWAEDHETIESDWRLIYTVALALMAVGSGRLIGSDEVLVVFAAGATFVQVVRADDREEEDRGQEAVNRFFAIPIFVLLGLTLPWDGWRELGWSGVGLAAAVLLLRRPPVLLLLRPLLPDVRTVPEALFLGWFGPVAVAAIYYASLMEHRLSQPIIWHVVSLVVCASVVAHGATGAPGTRLFGRVAGTRDETETAG